MLFALFGIVLLSAPGNLSGQRSGTRPLTIENIFGGQAQAGARQVSISPDGKLIAVAGDGPQGQGVYATTPDGSATPKLWFQGGTVAAWFPDSQRVVVLAPERSLDRSRRFQRTPRR